MSVGSQNLCRLHYLLFYGVFFSLAWNLGVERKSTMHHLFIGAGNAATQEHNGDFCPFTQIIAALFFGLANAFAAAAQSGPNGQRKMVQYAAFPLYLGVFYLNRGLVQDFSTFTTIGAFVGEHVVLVVATVLFALSTHTLYIADRRA